MVKNIQVLTFRGSILDTDCLPYKVLNTDCLPHIGLQQQSIQLILRIGLGTYVCLCLLINHKIKLGCTYFDLRLCVTLVGFLPWLFYFLCLSSWPFKEAKSWKIYNFLKTTNSLSAVAISQCRLLHIKTWLKYLHLGWQWTIEKNQILDMYIF